MGLITLNRPKVNAASDGLLQDVIHACKKFDRNKEVGAVVITGNDKFFCGGADIKEMSTQTYADAIATNMFAGAFEVTAHYSRMPFSLTFGRFGPWWLLPQTGTSWPR